FGEVPQSEAKSKAGEAKRNLEELVNRPGAKIFRRRVTEDGWVPQDWTFYLVPVSDGVEMVFLVKTGDIGLPEVYGVQQCFRLTGLSNEAWRHKYARTAAFSEFDLWRDAPAGVEKTSLSWVLRNGDLRQLPVEKETLGCRTLLGESIDGRRSDGHLETLEHI